jgi:bifunctional non-homologous end joining protein LigD
VRTRSLTVSGAKPGALPEFVRPELATLVTDPPSGDGFLHELKFDGYRILCRIDGGKVELVSRNGNDWTSRFHSVATAVRALPTKAALLDGEVAVLLQDGTTSFQALQNALTESGGGAVVYFVFDILHLDGQDLTESRLEDRKKVLANLLAAVPRGAGVRYSDHILGRGEAFFRNACKRGLEGIVSKRRDAPYRSGRGRDWVKVKCVKRQEVIIGGFTEPSSAGRKDIGALLIGVYDDDKSLRYIGKVGTGFTQASLRELRRRLDGLEQPTSPFRDPVRGRDGKAHWVRPQLVGEVEFTEWTADEKLRHPSFQGLRDDKPARSVVREVPRPFAHLENAKASPKQLARAPAKRRAAGYHPASDASEDAPRGGAGAGRRLRRDRAEREEAGVAAVAGVRLTHADRVVFSKQGTSKRDLALYYEAVADWILPHLDGRPTTLVRCPEGADKECFYQKHSGRWAPAEIRRVAIREKTKVGDYLVVDSLPALIGLVQMGILEIHTWNSVVRTLEQPDRIVFDLDPGPGVSWSRVVQTARRVRTKLEELGLASFVKTTGGKGLHVVVPIDVGPDWDRCASFSRNVAVELAADEPALLTANMSKSERTGKIFIDYLRNVRGATSVAAYSTRARPEAPVSVPLAWDELGRRTGPDEYTIATIPKRLTRLAGDPWAAYWTTRQRLPR